jgi:ech hydrogenase subunit E
MRLPVRLPVAGDVIGMSNVKIVSNSEFGPQHPLLPEPIKLSYTVSGDKIVDVIPTLGYVHRGIERACEINDYKRNIYLVERVCGICNYIHGATYCEAIENISGIEAPLRAKYLRSIWSEVSRLQSHFLWLGLYAEALGNEHLFMETWRHREYVLELIEKTNGHRIHLATNAIGGSRKDLNEDLIWTYKEAIKVIRQKTKILEPHFVKSEKMKKKTESVGILSKETAINLGACGPLARASGVKTDARLLGYAAYGQLDFEPVTHQGSDCWSRIQVRFDEISQSIDLIEQAIKDLPEGPILVQGDRFPNGSTVVRHEQPRGELFYYVEGNGTNKLSRCRIRTPTAANIPALVHMLIGEKVGNIPAIVHTIDPCISCTERMTYVKGGE